MVSDVTTRIFCHILQISYASAPRPDSGHFHVPQNRTSSKMKTPFDRFDVAAPVDTKPPPTGNSALIFPETVKSILPGTRIRYAKSESSDFKDIQER